MFALRWFETYLLPRVKVAGDRLADYFEPIRPTLAKRIMNLTDSAQEEFYDIQDRFAAVVLELRNLFIRRERAHLGAPALPLREILSDECLSNLPTELADARSLRSLVVKVERFYDDVQEALEESLT